MATGMLGLLDRVLIALYRTTGQPFLDYFAGTFILALLTVMLGEWTISLALKWNRSHNAKLERELEEKHHLSLAALEANDEKAYRACNDEAHDVFGRYFFNAIAHSAALLWPVPFALAWMQTRFAAVEFEFAYPISIVWESTGFFTTFFLCYLLARILFRHLRPYLPYFKGVQKTLDDLQQPAQPCSEPLIGA
jgi:hypothetical protein